MRDLYYHARPLLVKTYGQRNISQMSILCYSITINSYGGKDEKTLLWH